MIPSHVKKKKRLNNYCMKRLVEVPEHWVDVLLPPHLVRHRYTFYWTNKAMEARRAISVLRQQGGVKGRQT